ncbi:hypothetical protein F5Y16DRAFT_378583 [Xylariaceae sp. FL0255]|nr:hypothetical protein F5Y16DRAFT_378583 [Xylariaceae sp. FL0255]
MESRSTSPTQPPPGPALRSQDADRLKRLRTDSYALQWKLNLLAKKLKRSADDSTNYWSDLYEMEDMKVRIKNYIREVEEIEFVNAGGTKAQFEAQEDTLELTGAIEAHKRQRKLYEDHHKLLQSSSPRHRTFMSLFTCSRKGLGIENSGLGARMPTLKRKWKKALVKDYKLDPDTDEDRKKKMKWSVAQGMFVDGAALIAAHIFPSSWGQKTMTEWFGEECANDLYSSYNGLLLPQVIEKAMAEFAIVIVPDLPNDPTTEQVKEWLNSEAPEYKFRVLNPEHPDLQSSLPGGDKRTGLDLDQTRLQFRSKMRPRARFLWLWFVCSVLNQYWKASPFDGPQKISPQFGKGIWGTPGPYMKRAYVLGFAEEVGHEIAATLNLESGAMPSEGDYDDVPVKAGPLMVANRVIENWEKKNAEDEGEYEGQDAGEDEGEGEKDDELNIK